MTNTLRSEAILALANFFNNLKTCDKYQMFDIEIKNGALYCKTRSTETEDAEESGLFTHHREFKIDSYGLIHPQGQGFYPIP